ncbi:hypothetical protein FRC08_006209 [Ceratobasidium sp. 394]|nr:hypothetical protein FRC08_006209 [Ceratobasidium sp. 394]KAG9101186.1 hypothetical protein FS749_009648 [Ceratobasidium sp. UAMH 11750]
MNVDSSAAGERYWVRGSPTLASLLRQTAEELPHPTDQNRTLWDARLDKGHLLPNQSHLHVQASPWEDAQASGSGVDMLGSGSDYTVFLQRLGIASMDESFRTGYNSPVWHQHSVWDSVQWMETYGDPGFLKHIAVAKHLGLVLLRLTNQPILPFNTTQYAMDLDKFLNEVEGHEHTPDLTELDHAIKKVQRASRVLDERKEQATMDLEAVLAKAATQLERGQHVGECDALAGSRSWSLKYGLGTLFSQVLFWWQPFVGRSVSCELIDVRREIKSINKILSTFEQGFLAEDGIPGREWYRHLGVAPGRWLGYGATTFPALNEAIALDKNSTLAAHEAQRLTQLLENLAERLA